MAMVGALILVGVVVAYILAPVIQDRRASLEREDDELTDAQAARRVALLALRDVEYDYHTGKLDEKDYREVKRQLSAEALVAMKALEEDGGRDALEAEVAEMRQGLRSGDLCDVCGFRNPDGSRFCGACGTALEPRPTPAESA